MEKELNQLNFIQFMSKFKRADRLCDVLNCSVVFDNFDIKNHPTICEIDENTKCEKELFKIHKMSICILSSMIYVKTLKGWKMFYKQNFKMKNKDNMIYVDMHDLNGDMYRISFCN